MMSTTAQILATSSYGRIWIYGPDPRDKYATNEWHIQFKGGNYPDTIELAVEDEEDFEKAIDKMWIKVQSFFHSNPTFAPPALTHIEEDA